MEEVIKLLIGSVMLVSGIFIGNLLARYTKEELKVSQIWFKLIIFVSILSGAASLFLKSDVLLFTFSFIAIVTSRSLR